MSSRLSAARVPWSARVPFLAALVVLVIAVATVIRWSGPAVALSYRWEPGEVTRDRETLRMSMEMGLVDQAIETAIESSTVTRVLAVDAAGNATLEISTERLRVLEPRFPGAEKLEQQLLPPYTLVVSPEGRILSSDSPLLGPEGFEEYGQGFLTTPFLPEQPAAPGDAWAVDTEHEMGIGDGGFDLHAENELVRYDAVNGVETVVVRSDITGTFDIELRASDFKEAFVQAGVPRTDVAPLDEVGTFAYAGELELQGQTWIDPATGDVLRSEGDGTFEGDFAVQAEGVPALPFSFAMEMEIETERLA